MKYRIRATIALAVAAGLALSACGSAAGRRPRAGPPRCTSSASPCPRQANKAIAAEWAKTAAGKGVKFETSYGASGDQSRAVVAGPQGRLRALLGDQRRDPPGRRRASSTPDWNKGAEQGHRVVLGRRAGRPQGQPEEHQGLGRPDQAGRRHRHARTRPRRARRGGTRSRPGATSPPTAGPTPRPPSTSPSCSPTSWRCPDSGRDATTSFLGGTGDVLLAYENEAILATQNGEEFDWVVPGRPPS